MAVEPPKQVDARGLWCPWPIVELSKAIQTLEAGEALLLLATDPAFEPDLKAWISATGHELVSFEHAEGVMRAHIRKKIRP
jgi:tRNA 2-thiouridine synthesizing protein A